MITKTDYDEDYKKMPVIKKFLQKIRCVGSFL